MQILIDGYNLLKAIPECRGLEAMNPDGARDHLLTQLGRYRWLRGHQVTVVFDGWMGGHPVERHAHARGVHVIYSQRGERADEVIRRLAPQVAHQGVVVTSDRALASLVRQTGAEVVGSAEFGERLRGALVTLDRGAADEPTEESAPPHRSQKKGASRRPSRAERARERKFRNL